MSFYIEVLGNVAGSMSFYLLLPCTKLGATHMSQGRAFSSWVGEFHSTSKVGFESSRSRVTKRVSKNIDSRMAPWIVKLKQNGV
jgi:hypothetical protein